MSNKFYIILFIFFGFLNFKNLLAKDLNINAETIEIDKTSETLNATGNVEVIDEKNNTIYSSKIKYDKSKNILNTFGETEIITSEKYKIIGKDITYDSSKGIVYSNNETNITDLNGNKIFVTMFNYLVKKNM